jgi:hypothetical protein
MMEPDLIARQRSLLRDLTDLAAERARTAPAIEEEFRARQAAEEADYDAAYQAAVVLFATAREKAEHEIREARASVQGRFDAEQLAITRELTRERQRVEEQYDAEEEATQTSFQEAHWQIDAALEASRAKAAKQRRAGEDWLASQADRLEAIDKEARALLHRWGRLPEEEAEQPSAGRRKLREGQECLALAEAGLARLKAMRLPRYLTLTRLVGSFVLLWLVLVFPLGWLVTQFTGQAATLAGFLLIGLAASTVTTLAVAVVFTTVANSLASASVHAVWEPMRKALADAAVWRQHILESYAARYNRLIPEAEARHARDMHKATETFEARKAGVAARRAEEERRVEEHAQQRRQANEQRRADDLRQAEERYRRLATEVQQRYERDAQAVEERHRNDAAAIQAKRAADRTALLRRWREGLARVREAVADVTSASRKLFPAWDNPAWQRWTPPAALPPAVRFGEFRVPRTSDDLEEFNLPALCPFPERSLLFEAGEGGRDEAVTALQAVLFRLLTAIPPGKVRFTIVDPVGLGQNFAAFMHLADYDEQLVASRIWTEQSHIEQRLADLTAHMEDVIQKYLRNQYQTIAEYNAEAGEVAEPLRVLVVANFPANFTTEAARRLVSVAQSGARCGVCTLVTVDTRLPLPQGFDLADLEQAAVTLAWQEDRFAWKDADFGRFPLTLDAPPADDFITRILHKVGALAREAGRVEVPFEFIAPEPDKWWTGDSRRGLDVALGRAGATKRQYLRLGQGTSQHVLVAGKTGSGKSTLLHALITNLALQYSPDEAELYLVDFKKGVEFKTYAVHELPHARVVAIESEREFGLSVLQRLDAELKLRGERFREVRAQDLNAYRQVRPNERVPRILLIVDEFQEFFTEDDRLAQDAAQLLDRLVRQGRAFGLHIMLGSQTLGGAYSLARSTIDQMAVRIALQCSEADAHLILSDGNSAARLLTRPGEAIYNDANGRVEGNNPFQVVWLPDDRREHYLERLQEMDRQRPSAAPPALVFEGNLPADVCKNYLLNRLLQEPAAFPRAPLAWLGEAIAIKEPTAAAFARQNGDNLLIVGQQDEAALGMLTTAAISLAAQAPQEGGTRFYLIDGSPADAALAGYLARLTGVLPQAMRAGGWRELPPILAELAAEVERRQKEADAERMPVYLVLYGMQRLRDLRRAEDDYGFGRRDEAATPSQQFATVLREGAALGVHTLAWCDTLNNLQRILDRQGLREFSLRVVFQMGVADSSSLIDSPAASKLGVNRALFSSEETGVLEKFRPYGPPPIVWLEQARQQLARPVGAGR